MYYVYYSQVKDGVYNKGKQSTNNGLIGMLERDEIDVALASLSLTFDRSKVENLTFVHISFAIYKDFQTK